MALIFSLRSPCAGDRTRLKEEALGALTTAWLSSELCLEKYNKPRRAATRECGQGQRVWYFQSLRGSAYHGIYVRSTEHVIQTSYIPSSSADTPAVRMSDTFVDEHLSPEQAMRSGLTVSFAQNEGQVSLHGTGQRDRNIPCDECKYCDLYTRLTERKECIEDKTKV